MRDPLLLDRYIAHRAGLGQWLTRGELAAVERYALYLGGYGKRTARSIADRATAAPRAP